MNVKNFLAGHLKAKLTDEGISQAKLLGERLKRVQVDRIYSSDLLRARDTTGHLLTHLSAPVREYRKQLEE